MTPANESAPSAAQAFGIGSTVWKQGWLQRRSNDWGEAKVTGETSRSWLCGDGWAQFKIPKKRPERERGIARSAQERFRLDWVDANRWRIGDHIRTVDDYTTLRKIADLIGYQEKQ